jgi:hypothetical protein
MSRVLVTFLRIHEHVRSRSKKLKFLFRGILMSMKVRCIQKGLSEAGVLSS